MPLFTEREIIHMKDVKGLIQGVYMFQWITLGYLLAATVAAYCLAEAKRVDRRNPEGGVLGRGSYAADHWGVG